MADSITVKIKIICYFLLRMSFICLIAIINMVGESSNIQAVEPVNTGNVSRKPPEISADQNIIVKENYFVKDGKPIYMTGVYDVYALSIWESDKGFNWKKYLNDLANYHINYTRIWLDFHIIREDWPAQFGNQRWAWKRKVTKFDLTDFDEKFWDRLKKFLDYAEAYNINVEITIFNPWSARTNWKLSPWNPENNVNNYSANKWGDLYSGTDNSQLLDIQKLFIDKLLVETESYFNIIYEIANEGGSELWVDYFVRYIKERSDKLVSVCDSYSTYDALKGGNDIVNFHGGGSIDIVKMHQRMLSYGSKKPTSYDEHYSANGNQPGDRTTVRNIIWAMFTGGGYSGYLDWSNWRGAGNYTNGYPSQTPHEILEDQKNLIDFVNSIKFRELKPNDKLVKKSPGTAFTIASPGIEYVTYIFDKSGENELEIELKNGIYEVKWYNPTTGSYFNKTEKLSGGEKVLLIPPVFSKDIVLHVCLCDTS